MKRHLHIIAFSLESIISSPPKRYSQTLCHSWFEFLNISQRNMSSSSSSSQDSDCPSPTMAEIRASAAALNVEPVKFSPQRSMATASQKTENQHARNTQRSSVSSTGKISGSSSSVPSEIANREGTRYVQETVDRIITRILNENRSVPGISVPLNQKPASPSLAADPDVTGDVMTSADHVQATPADSDLDTLADSPVKAKDGIPGSQDEQMTRTGPSPKKYRVKSVGSSKPKRTQIAKKRKTPEVTISNVDDDNDNASSASSGKEGK